MGVREHGIITLTRGNGNLESGYESQLVLFIWMIDGLDEESTVIFNVV